MKHERNAYTNTTDYGITLIVNYTYLKQILLINSQSYLRLLHKVYAHIFVYNIEYALVVILTIILDKYSYYHTYYTIGSILPYFK